MTIKSLKTKTIQGFAGPWGRALVVSGLLLLAGFGAWAQSPGPVVNPVTPAYLFVDSIPVAGTPATTTLTFTFTTGGSLGGPPAELTLGAPGLDFTDAGTGSLTVHGAHTYQTGDTGTVDVVFRPTLPGWRYGAVVLRDATGAVVATTFLQGLGSGPQVVFQPWTQAPIALPSINSGDQPAAPTGVAVDGAGRIYVADPANNQVVMESQATGGSQTVVYAPSAPPGTQGAAGVALDGAGNVYVADTPNNQVLKLVPRQIGSGLVYVPTVVLGGLNGPMAVAVDGAGNVCIADTGNNQVLRVAWSGTAYAATATVVDAVLSGPQGVAVDGAGNVFIADTGEGRVWAETPSGGGYTRIGLPGLEGFSGPVGLALDPAGDVFVAENNYGPVIQNTLQGGAWTSGRILIGAPLSTPSGMAMDGLGNMYIADPGFNQVLRIDLADPPDLTFDPAAVGVASDDSPQTVTVWNIGNADLTLPVPVSGADPVVPGGWLLDPSTSLGTTTSQSGTPGALPAGASATLAIDFSPTCAGPAEGALVLTDNALNAAGPAYAAQTILLSGWGVGVYVTPSTLPRGQVGAAYAVALAGAGGTGPYTLGLAAGTLPPGLGLGSTGGLTGTPTSAGTYPFTMQATDSTSASGSSPLSLTIDPGAATVTLASLAQTYTGSPLAATASTSPSGLGVDFTYDGGSAAPVAAGSHAVVATVTDGNYRGSASGTLVIAKAAGTVTLGGLSQAYTGSPVAATATTVPPGLGVAFTYDGSPTPPTALGSYAVLASLSDADYQGSASGTLVIARAAGTVILGGLSQAYTGSPVAATATTVPPGLAVTFTYNGSATAPTAPGSYAVLASLADATYQGSASGTLVIAKAAGTVTLGGLAQTWTGSPLAASATTVPPGLAVTFTYNGNATAPTAPGSYAVLGTITDTDYQGSGSGTLVISEEAAKVLLTVSGDDHLGDPETLTVVVSGGTTASRAGTADAPVPTGTVTFLDGTTVLATVPLTGGAAVFTTTALAAGPHLLSATYSGDAQYPGSPSNSDSEVVVPPALAIQAPAQELALDPGGTVTTELALSSVGAFSGGPIFLTVTGLPPWARAELSPAVLTALPATVTLRIHQYSRTTLAGGLRPGSGPASGPWAGALVAAILLLLTLAWPWPRAFPARAALALAFALACGTAPPDRPAGAPPPNPRPATYDVVVKAAAPGATLATVTLHLTAG